MNDSNQHPDAGWSELIRRARGDLPPVSDVENVIRALRRERLTDPAVGWFASFELRFTSSGLAGLACAAALLTLSFTAWKSWDSLQAMAWTEVVTIEVGEPT